VASDDIGPPALRETHVQKTLAGGVGCGPILEATAEAVLFRIPRVGRFLVRAEGPVLVERAPGASDGDLECFRDGPVSAARALLLGRVVLGAAAVAIHGKAVAVCGVSGAGKSAVAAALAQRGHAVLADSVTAIADDASRTVAPVSPELVLWPDTACELGLDERCGRRVRAGLKAHAYQLGPDPVAEPLAQVVFLRVAPLARHSSSAPIRGAAKVQALIGASWYRRLLAALPRSDAHIQALTHLAADVRCVELQRPARGLASSRLAELVEKLLE
jgi:hypothetical protein